MVGEAVQEVVRLFLCWWCTARRHATAPCPAGWCLLLLLLRRAAACCRDRKKRKKKEKNGDNDYSVCVCVCAARRSALCVCSVRACVRACRFSGVHRSEAHQTIVHVNLLYPSPRCLAPTSATLSSSRLVLTPSIATCRRVTLRCRFWPSV